MFLWVPIRSLASHLSNYRHYLFDLNYKERMRICLILAYPAVDYQSVDYENLTG